MRYFGSLDPKDKIMVGDKAIGIDDSDHSRYIQFTLPHGPYIGLTQGEFFRKLKNPSAVHFAILREYTAKGTTAEALTKGIDEHSTKVLATFTVVAGASQPEEAKPNKAASDTAKSATDSTSGNVDG